MFSALSSILRCTVVRERLSFSNFLISFGQIKETAHAFLIYSLSIKLFPATAISLEISKLTLIAVALSLPGSLKKFCSERRLASKLSALRLFSFISNTGDWFQNGVSDYILLKLKPRFGKLSTVFLSLIL